ncbi:MAG TPA: protein-L-isoaspartate(D-aspartate) O-methyltransferase, partial [Hyphomicrobium sp.]|nr:protein-L-isoaspartate(D-aspartate) O-methyltransferase [Hyphomicrobium sp.]
KLMFCGLVAMTVTEEPCADARHLMVDEIVALARRGPAGQRELSPSVLAAMRKVPRHEFVPSIQRYAAYRNRPLSIGEGQTISQPYIVALMTDLLRIGPDDRVLEIGTGSGYQTAVLAEIAREVYTVEIIENLGERAKATLDRLGYRNVHAHIDDGARGWPEAAPFDAVIVTAAPAQIPTALIEQLKPQGRMVIPVGTNDQALMVVTKNADGTTLSEEIVPVRFVPLTRDPD